MSDSDYISLTLPYVCCSCGAPMRDRGIDGRCKPCIEAPAVRCERCRRVRLDPGGRWEIHLEPCQREVLGMCSTCGHAKRNEDEARYLRLAREVEKRAAKPHYVHPLDDDDWDQLMRGK